MYLYSNFNTFSAFLHPHPVDKKVTPPKVKSWIRHCLVREFGIVVKHRNAETGITSPMPRSHN